MQTFAITATIDGEEKAAKATGWNELQEVLGSINNFKGHVSNVAIKEIA